MATFHSGRWNTGTNPDLAFVSVGPDSRLPDRRILEKFPRSQHRPSLIVPPRLTLSVPSMPVKRWNFRKAKWSHYNALTNQLAKSLLPPDTCCCHLMWTGHTRTSAMPSAQQPKSISHVVDETTTLRVGMLSVRTSIRCSCNRLRDLTLAGLLQPCCPGLTENAGTDGLRQSKPSTFLTPVVKHGAY